MGNRAWDKSEKGRASYRAYHWKNRTHRLVYLYEWRENNREKVLSYYSQGKLECAKCGFKDIRALCLDHINNNGAEHRKSLGNGKKRAVGSCDVYLSLIKKGFPDGFQVLCHNCNQIKEVEKRKNKRVKYGQD